MLHCIRCPSNMLPGQCVLSKNNSLPMPQPGGKVIRSVMTAAYQMVSFQELVLTFGSIFIATLLLFTLFKLIDRVVNNSDDVVEFIEKAQFCLWLIVDWPKKILRKGLIKLLDWILPNRRIIIF